ncbi:hypothetical protein GCM10007063_08170 [Lentibacillus kapialis]|uniref:RsgI N-terminal anti-sigma domain-containing protein n=1 Tax=Lentibacillus kapialis TaxID=340214 RepID=A0A917PR30_9BACI|nr:anti-sigma factor domain-containing protein [Lentibacillus kapialis]GGJ88041.1 hypothetical protein GCM10007063_08170 [Lentibacillus kapialis]
MQKGIVMEMHRDYLIVMCKDGAFQKARLQKNAVVGMEVSYQPFAGKRHPVLHYKSNPFQLMAIAFIVLFIIPGYFVMGNDKTYAWVNISINPNIELKIDDHLKVTSINFLNKDAVLFEQQLQTYKGRHLTDVIQAIMSESEKADLLQNGKKMLAGVSYMTDKHQVSVINEIEDYFMVHDQEWEIVTMKIPKEIREQAQKREESMNQLMAVSLVEPHLSHKSDKNNETEKPSVKDTEREILHTLYNHMNNHSGTADKQ